ncbi:hypothetical protein LP419_03335 [Massilia sp. H-1]|nr:hypothetical protein LP419_03335 [Massilia sp. H-1]
MGITPLWTARAAAPHSALIEAEAEAVAEPELAPAPAPAAAPAPAPVPDIDPAIAERRRRALETPPVSSHFGPRPSAAESAWGEEPPAPPATDEEIARMDW